MLPQLNIRYVVWAFAAVGLVLILVTQGISEVLADEFRCDITSKFACGPAGCKPTKPGVWNLVDLDRDLLSRCDQKGCEAYDAEITVSGLFYDIEIGVGALAKMALDGSTYLEVVTTWNVALISFGSCQ